MGEAYISLGLPGDALVPLIQKEYLGTPVQVGDYSPFSISFPFKVKQLVVILSSAISNIYSGYYETHGCFVNPVSPWTSQGSRVELYPSSVEFTIANGGGVMINEMGRTYSTFYGLFDGYSLTIQKKYNASYSNLWVECGLKVTLDLYANSKSV